MVGLFAVRQHGANKGMAFRVHFIPALLVFSLYSSLVQFAIAEKSTVDVLPDRMTQETETDKNGVYCAPAVGPAAAAG
jgi:hypothetical protein